jgi:thiamine kinase-like enzyme
VDEQPLPGGFVTVVIRAGDTVRREPAARAFFVHDLLRLLDEWPGAPRFLGIDDEGREILTFIDGYVAWQDPRKPAISTDPVLRSVGRLVREFHDLTAGTALADDQEVVCHNDLSPKNTVYSADGTEAIAFIDWDIAAPGRRIHDIAFSCWQYAIPGTPAQVATQWRALLDGYGPADTSDLIDTILWWQHRTSTGIESEAAAGDPAMARLVALDIPAQLRRIEEWTRTNSAVLAAELGEGGVG